ncbi:MAG: LegC family aminotransferase [Bacteroidetes bacterium]|nr:LegC family aminotransferase [Bacteroidota bacterium]
MQEIVDFIRQLYNSSEFIPLHAPVFMGNEKKYLNECIDSTFVSYVGKFVTQFEEMTASYTGAKHAVAVVNGTAALQIALTVTGVEKGDEVITQPLTFVATANAIVHAGAQPVFVDVDRDTLGMSPESLSDFLNKNTSFNKGVCFNKITGKPIKAIVPVHIFGHPCRITEIVEIARKYNIKVVEDSAESLGSYYQGQHTGTFGEVGILSYNGNKTITTGGGGMIITDNEDLAKRAKHITTTAKVPHPWEYVHDEIAYNYRLTNLNAAVGVAQMEQIEEILENKRKTAQKYQTFFEMKNAVDFIKEPINSHSNYWLNAILFNNRNERDAFLKYTNERGIMTRPIWQLMNKLKMFKNAQTDDLINAEWLEHRVVNVPSSIKILN